MLENTNSFLTNTFGEFGPLILVGVLGMLMILLTLPLLLRRDTDPLDKLKDQAQGKEQDANEKDKRLRTSGNRKDKLEKYSGFLEPQDEDEYSAVALKLLQAGYRGKNAVRTFHFLQFALGLGMLGLGVLYAIAMSVTGEPTTQALIFSVLIPGGAGYMLPKYWVTRRQAARCIIRG